MRLPNNIPQPEQIQNTDSVINNSSSGESAFAPVNKDFTATTNENTNAKTPDFTDASGGSVMDYINNAGATVTNYINKFFKTNPNPSTSSSNNPQATTPANESNASGADKYKLTEEQRDARYYEGGKPSGYDGYGNSTNVKSDVVAKDIVSSVKENWHLVDPKVRKIFDSGEADKFFGPNPPAGFKELPGWKKAAIFELSKNSFETAGTLDPNHKDPGDQAWGGFSLYNKKPDWKNYGLNVDLRGPEGKAALTSPGFGVIADLNSIPASIDLEQPENTFDKNQALDRAHYTFVDVKKGLGEYYHQKSRVLQEAIGVAKSTKGIGKSQNIMDFVLSNF
jgi:hypothetical protein